MHSILFTVPWGWSVAAYPFFLSLAALMAVGGGMWVARRQGISWKLALVFWLAVGSSAFLGARLWHGVTNFEYYRIHPERWLALDSSGFAITGGIMLAAVVGFGLARIWKVDVWRLGDHVVPFLGLSIALVRIGCYLNGCCFGQETVVPWGVEFPLFSPAHQYQLLHGSTELFSVHPVHPTELYELTAALLGSGFAWWLMRRHLPTGTVALAFAIWFLSFRLVDHFFRVPAETFVWPGYFYPVLYVFLIAISAGLLQWRINR